MIVQRYESSIAATQPDAPAIIAMVRSDVIALYRAFHHADFLHDYRATYGQDAQPWDQSLLHQPVGVTAREKAQAAILPYRQMLIPILAALRGCSDALADALLSALLQRGLPGIIDLRCASGNESASLSREREQIRITARQLLNAVQPTKRDQILARLEQLHDAVIASGVPFPLLNLIRHLPSNRYRRKRQRRGIPDVLTAAFAERIGSTQKAAWSYIHNLMIYGPLGMLPKREWAEAIHPRLWSYLHMFKYGRLDDTISESILTDRVNSYAVVLGIEPLPKQIIIAICRHFSKPRYYNSGDGEAIAGVPLRKALKIAGVARLHEQWIVIPIELDIDLVSPALRPLGGTCSVVMVFDGGCQRPVGFWLSEKALTSVEAGLALYDAVFHRNALDWPLRGVPEHILIPKTLMGAADHLQQAATFLMAELIPGDSPDALIRKSPYIKQLISDLRAEYKPAYLSGRRRAPNIQLTIQQAEQKVRQWLYQKCFPNHRTDPVPPSLRKHGVALPGYDTPAAGWLLPVVAEPVITIRGGVQLGNLCYRDESIGIEPGVAVRVRSLPRASERIRSVFVEYPDEHTIMLHYLPLGARS
jgi:hypothetical protein